MKKQDQMLKIKKLAADEKKAKKIKEEKEESNGEEDIEDEFESSDPEDEEIISLGDDENDYKKRKEESSFIILRSISYYFRKNAGIESSADSIAGSRKNFEDSPGGLFHSILPGLQASPFQTGRRNYVQDGSGRFEHPANQNVRGLSQQKHPTEHEL